MPLTPYGPYFLVLLLFWSSPSWGQYSPKDLLQESNTLFENGDYGDAMTGYAQLLSLEPGNVDYNFKYGATALYGDPGKREEAIKYLKFASGKPGVDVRVWYFLGRAYHLNYQFADALGAYQKFAEKASKKDAGQWQITQVMETARNGQTLLSQIKDVTVLDKKKTTEREFFRLYDLSSIGGKILVTPEELLTSLDVKNNHRSLIHFRGEGTTVYFSSYGKDGQNGLDIYSAQVLPGGGYSTPAPLPGNINTPYDDDFPYMHPDGKTFYFSSKGHSSMGGYDIFRASYDAMSGTFGSPANMDFAINTPDDDIFYIADSLNRLANFASGRSSRQGDLHVYRVNVDMAPVELTLVKGSFANRISPGQRTIKIIVTDAATNKRVDVQYSDPGTGDYLLSFPKSGKYKLSVEAQGSRQAHSGMVDIPQGDGLSAYLQDMELVAPSGLEKLIINNRFGQKYQGDLSALVQEMLRKRAELEINFDDVPETPSEPVAQQAKGKDAKMAYNDAGFGAGLSNDEVLQNAYQRVELFERNAAKLRAQQSLMAQQANEQYAEAEKQIALAEARAKVDPSTDGGKSSYEAAVAQWQAREALERARTAQELSEALGKRYVEVNGRAENERSAVEILEADIATGDYDIALEALRAENERLKNFDRVAARVDMVAEVSLAAKEARIEADRYMRRASNMRTESEELISNRNAKQRQAENLKGKAASEAEAEVQRLNVGIADLEQSISRAYESALEKEAAALRVNDQIALLQNVDEQALNAFQNNGSLVEAPAAGILMQALSTIETVELDGKAAAAYIQQHPEALAQLGGGNNMRSFQQLTGVRLASEDSSLAMTEAAADNQSARPDENKSIDQAAQPDSKTVVSEMDGVQTELNNQDNDVPAVEPTTAVIPQRQTGKNFELPNDTADSAADLNDTPEIDRPGQEQMDDVDAPDWKNLNGKELQASIAEAEARKYAAMDWLSIIDESMAAIEVDVARGESVALEQNEGYKRMKAEKLQEIEKIDKLIAQLESAAAIQKSAAAKPSLAEAIADVDTLDVSYVIRLESKINEASSSPAFVADLNKIDSQYVDALTAIEMSGLSAPEIAQQRIVLNEAIVADLLSQINEGDQVLSAERLIELRRIKVLEIREDRAVMEGRVAYVPRSVGAMAYSAMVAGDDGTKQSDSSEIRANEAESVSEMSGISPALKAALEKPYSWDDVVPGYIDMIAKEVDANANMGELNKRLDAHSSVLEKIDDDIEVFSVLVNSPEAANDPRISQRFEQLIAEKQMIAEMRDADQAVLASITVTEPGAKEETEEAMSAQIPGKEIALEAANIEDTEVKKARIVEAEVDQFIAGLNSEIEEGYANSKDSNASTTGKLRKMSELNAASTVKLSARIDALTLELDNATNDEARDILQIQIQKLDALLADKQQEADRYATEAESADMVADTGNVQIPYQDQQASTNPTADNETNTAVSVEMEDAPAMDLEEIQIAYAAPIELEQFTFRSLQANVSGARLNEAASQAIEKRNDIAVKAEAYKNAATPAEKEAAYTAFQKAANEVKLADMELNKILKASNAAEVAFFSANNSALNEGLQNGQLSAALKKESTELYSRSVKIEEEIAQNRQLKNELDAFDTAAYTEMLREERALITEMEEVMVALEAIVSQADAEVLAEENVAKLKLTEKQNKVSDASETTDESASLISDEAVLAQIEPEEGKTTNNPPQDLKVSETGIVQASTAPVANESVDQEAAQSEAAEDGSGQVDLLAVELKPENAIEVAAMKGISMVDIPSERRERLVRVAPVLNNSIEFAQADKPMEKFTLLKSKGISADDLDELDPLPAELKYLSEVLIADSLKKLEVLHAEAIVLSFAQAEERSREAERLKGSVVLETNARNKQFILDKAERVEAEAELYYQSAAFASVRRDSIRSRRQEVEQSIVFAMNEMDVAQVNKLNAALKSAPYTVVAADLASLEEKVEAPARPRAAAKTETVIAEFPEAEKPESTVPDNTAAESLQTDITTEVPKTESAVEVPSGTLVTEEPSRKRAEMEYKGNWLNTVEIIADKTDFSDVNETLFGLADKAVYSAEKPIPVDPEMPDGLIFQVQIGAFRNPIPQDLFQEIAPIMGQKLDNGITRYRAGLFKGYGEAIDARNLVRGMGYKDAFVVAYVDGERLSAEQARSILSQAASLLAEAQAEEAVPAADSTAPTEVSEAIESPGAIIPVETVAPKLVEQPKADYYNDPEAAEAVQVEVVRGLFYTVQVGVYSKPVKLDQLYNLNELNSELTEKGLIRYTSGRFSSVASAGEGKQRAITAGVNDAFITAYFNGKRISLSEAEGIIAREGEEVLNLGMDMPTAPKKSVSESVEDRENEKMTSPALNEKSDEDEINYVVVLASFNEDLPQEVAIFLLERSDVQIRKIEGPGGQSMFVSSEFQSKEEAEQFLSEAKEAGITSAIMGASVNGQIKAIEAK